MRVFNQITSFPINVIGFLKKEFSLILKKKKYLYLSIMLPLIMGLIYILTLTGGVDGVKVMICDFDDTYLTSQAVSQLQGFEVKISKDENCITDMNEQIKKGKYLFGIVMEKGFTFDVENLHQTKVVVYYDNSEPAIAALADWRIDAALSPFKTQLITSLSQEIQRQGQSAKDQTELALELIEFSNNPITSRLEDKVKQIDSDLEKIANLDPYYLTSPIITEETGVHEKFALIDVGIAPLYVILSLFLVLMLCSTGLIYDRKIGLFSRIRASNASMFSYLISKLLFFLVLSILQFIILFLIFLMFGSSYHIDFLLLLKAIVFISLVHTLIGFLIGLVSDSEGVSVLISLIITLPMLFLSGMFYPLQLMPSIMQWVVKIIPVQLEIIMIKQAMLFGGIINNYLFLIPLGLFIFALYIVQKTK